MDKEYAKYLLQKTKEDYNLIADDFSNTRENPWEEIEFLFNDYLVPATKSLDIGCGNGRYYPLFRDRKIDYVGIDNSEKLIQIAKNKYPEANFQTAEALNLPFSDNFFDSVYSIAVLHHIPSQELRNYFLKEVERVLVSGGLLILTVWRFHRPEGRCRILKYIILKLIGNSKLDFGDVLEPWGKKIERYYHCFSKGELVGLVKSAGFKIKKIDVVKNNRGNRQNIYLVAEKQAF